MTGPTAGFVTNKNITVENLNDFLPSAENFKDIMWAYQLGAGVDILFLSLDVRYEWGLNNIYEAPSGAEPYNVKTNLWQVTLGFKLM